MARKSPCSWSFRTSVIWYARPMRRLGASGICVQTPPPLWMDTVAAAEMVERAGRALIDAASAPAKVILFGSHARGDANEGSDFDLLGDRA